MLKKQNKMSRNIILLLTVSFFFHLSCSHNTADEAKMQEYLRTISIAEKQYQSAYWIDRRNAVNLASKYPYSRTEKFLQKASSDPYNKVRIEAVRSLALFNTPSTISVLSEIAQMKNDYVIRLEALNVLAEFKSPACADIFIFSYDDANWMIREAAVKGLFSIDHTKIGRIQNEYFPLVISDDSLSVRISALNSLSYRDVNDYPLIRAEVLKKDNLQKYTYLCALLSALEGFMIDAELAVRIKELLVSLNAEVRVRSLKVLKKSAEISDNME